MRGRVFEIILGPPELASFVESGKNDFYLWTRVELGSSRIPLDLGLRKSALAELPRGRSLSGEFWGTGDPSIPGGSAGSVEVESPA